MVECCGRLPLAIIALGGILAKKNNSLTGWREVSRNVESFLREDKKMRVEDVLALSYDDLPPRSKSCFVYLSHFPADYEIQTQRLIQLLVADGIVPVLEKGENIAEDVAEGCLQELAERAKKDNFLFVVDESNASWLSTIRKVRRVSMHKLFRAQYIRCPNLRSLSFFKTSCPGDFFEGFWTYIFINMKLLRVLNYEGRHEYVEYKLMEDIGNLIHLRFLSLRDLRFKGSELPSSLENLRCLQTLDLRLGRQYSIHVPDVLWKMEQLRHLYLPRHCTDNTKLKLGTLRHLLTLVNFNIKNCFLKDLSNMTNLRELEICGPFKIEGFNGNNLDENPPIIQAKYLHSLTINSKEGIIDPRHLNHLISNCSSIYNLILHVEISKLPEDRYLPSNFAYILQRCNFERDPTPILEHLPNLRALRIF
ncbi:hypothetical protein V6N11_030761 [Hibiscus sabdariffa]|uniref:NB-ARC domain-containing protein n=1 Tax=Hibiscus sabdariffa TaxID=183260 RepID=A0ABR2NBP5_9ROSI